MKAKNGQAFFLWRAKGKPPNKTQYIKKYRISTNNNPVKVWKYLAGLFFAKFAEWYIIPVENVKMSDCDNVYDYRHFYFL